MIDIIKNDWFKNHKAEYKEVGVNIRILEWKNPKTNNLRLHYLMDDNKLYVSGDLNSAMYRFSVPATLKSFNKTKLFYFVKNLAAYEGRKRDFNSKKAQIRITEEIKELRHEDNVFEEQNSEEYYKTLQKLKEKAKSSTSVEYWKLEIISSGLYDKLSRFNCDAYEWIFDIGNEIPNSIKAHFIGLQMAAEQLNI